MSEKKELIDKIIQSDKNPFTETYRAELIWTTVDNLKQIIDEYELTEFDPDCLSPSCHHLVNNMPVPRDYVNGPGDYPGYKVFREKNKRYCK